MDQRSSSRRVCTLSAACKNDETVAAERETNSTRVPGRRGAGPSLPPGQHFPDSSSQALSSGPVPTGRNQTWEGGRSRCGAAHYHGNQYAAAFGVSQEQAFQRDHAARALNQRAADEMAAAEV